jgi:hypothetical protein
MGGVIARGLLHLPSYRPFSIRCIYTLGSPHSAPVIWTDMFMRHYYDMIDSQRWNAGNLCPFPVWWISLVLVIFILDMEEARSLMVISIAGGNRDILIEPRLTSLPASMYHHNNTSQSLSLLSHSIPGVDLNIDHQVIIY